MKIKKQPKIIKPCTECFNPQYFKFNFTYMENIEHIEAQYKVQMLSRMIELSKSSFLSVSGFSKNIGFETEDISKLRFKKDIPHLFATRFSAKDYKNKLTIVRLYTNDNPILGRIIGVLINKVFYILFVDIGGKSYSH